MGFLGLACRGAGAPAPDLDEARFLPGFDPEALVEGGPIQGGEAPPLAVLDRTPEGPEAEEPVRLRFTHPVVDPRAPPAGVRLRLEVAEGDPAAPSGWRAIPGESRWSAPDTLTWTGESALPRASVYRVALEGSVRGATGVVEGIEWGFETPRPTLSTDGSETYEPVAADAPVFLAVDPPASAREVAAHLHASALGRGEAIATRVRAATSAELEELGEGAWLAVTAARGWPRGVEVTLTIDAALRSGEGPLSLGEPWVASFQTRDRLRVLGIECGFQRGETCEDGPITVALTTEIDESHLGRVIVRPRPADLAIDASRGDEAPTIEITGDFQADVTYRITLPPDLEDRHGQRLGRRVVEAVRFGPPVSPRVDHATLSLADPRGVFWRAEDARIGVLEIQLPDDLTRFRVTAVASAPLPNAAGSRSAPARFGEGEAAVEVDAPLMVRAALPRVLRPGDVAEVAALVTIPEGRGGTLVVDAAAGGGIAIVGPSRAELRVRTPGPHRVPFKVEARAAGEPAVTLKATLRPGHGAPLASGVREVLPVAIERTQVERAAIYGSFDADQPVAIPVRIPGDLRPDHGGLSLTVRSSATGDLEDAAAYLIEYPYGCLEQTASRLLPLIAVKDLADRVTSSGEVAALADAAVARILSMQRDDGGFAMWPDAREAAPFAGAYATWMLGLASEAGIDVPAGRLARARRWLAARATSPLPASSSARTDALIERALALHVLAAAGEAPPEGLAALYERRGDLPIFARVLLLMAIHRVDPGDPRVTVLARQLSAAIEVLPEVAHVVPRGASHSAYYDSPARTDAMALIALLQIDPADPRIEKLARGLAGARSAGRWRNTQENAWALLGLARYARAREGATPDFELRAWVGARELLSVAQRGRADLAHTAEVPMADLLRPIGPGSDAHVILDRDGRGRVYYRLGMTWAVPGDAPPRSQGLTVQREIRGEDGVVAPDALVAGRRYAIDVTVEAVAPLHHVVVEVPLPGGLEAIDLGLGGGSAARALPRIQAASIRHQEIHADRVLLFAEQLPPGATTHTVLVLATAPGRYTLPGAVAEAMYSPEVRGRSRADAVTIAPR